MNETINKKKINAKLIKKIAIFGLPVITLVAVIIALMTGKGDKSKAAYNYDIDEVLSTVGHLTVVEIVPDLCQVQFPYLVSGQEPIAHMLYDKENKYHAELMANQTDLKNFGNIVYVEETTDAEGKVIPAHWENQNDYLNYVYGKYEKNDNGDYFVKQEAGNEESYYKWDGKFYDAAGNVSASGSYIKNEKGVLFQAKKNAAGKFIRYELVEQLDKQQVVYVALTPSMLNDYVAKNPDFLLNGIPYRKTDGTIGYTGATMVCIERGNYGHLEGFSAKYGKYSYIDADGNQVDVNLADGTHNPNRTYGEVTDFTWASIKALYEYAGIFQMPTYFDYSLASTGNLKKLFCLLKVAPYATMKPVYDSIDASGNLDYTYTWYDVSGNERTTTMNKFDETTFAKYYMETYLGKEWEGDTSKVNEQTDKTGQFESYMPAYSTSDNLLDNIYFGNGTDLFLGYRFKTEITGGRHFFREVYVLEEIGSDEAITTASVFKYLMRLSGLSSLKHEIKVLEIEPSIDFKFAKTNKNTKVFTFEKNEDEIKDLLRLMGYIPNDTGVKNVTVDTMYSGAFAGFKGDLAEYDLIYIGNRQGPISTDASKLLYKFVGDIQFGDGLGQLYGNSNVTGGNDIPSWMMENLVKYVESGRVLLIGDKLYRKDNKVIDEKSVLYQYLDDLIAAPTSVSDAHIGKLSNAYDISCTKPLIQFADGGKPVEYDANGAKAQLTMDTGLTNANGMPTYVYNYEFTAYGHPNTKYNVYLYLDMNADGRFVEISSGTDESEKVDLDISFYTDAVGKSIDPNDSTSSTISASVNLTNVKGLVPWKIVIEEEGNEYNRDSEVGYTVCKPDAADKEIINVLQIMPNTGGTFNLGNTKLKIDDTSNTIGSIGSRDYEKTFVKELEKLKTEGYYDIRIHAITVAEFEAWYDTSNSKAPGFALNDKGVIVATNNIPPAKYVSGNADTDRLAGTFDMVIIGFGDKFGNGKSDITSDSAIDNLYDFAKKGNSLLLAHDLISRYIGEAKDSSDKINVWHKKFTLKFRDLAGQDRFNYLGTNDSLVYSDPGSLSEISKYGYATAEVVRIAAADKNNYGNGTYAETDANRLFEDHNVIGDKGWTTSTIALNKGPVTLYPYILDETLEVQTTHTQYYQLNLEDESVMVWFNLAGKTTSSKSGNLEDGQIYNLTFNDAYCNFYVYTKGNITYTGAGHAFGDTTPPTTGEMELFINTIVAAIRVGNHAPKVTVTNAMANKNVTESDYIVNVSESDDSCEINYIVNDIDLVKGTPIRNVKVYWDRTKDGAYDSSSTDVLLYEYDSNKNYATAVKNNTLTGDVIPSDGLVLNGEPLTLATMLEKYSQGKSVQDKCVYINIIATDAKGASHTARVKIRVLELYNLE